MLLFLPLYIRLIKTATQLLVSSEDAKDVYKVTCVVSFDCHCTLNLKTLKKTTHFLFMTICFDSEDIERSYPNDRTGNRIE